MLFNSIDFAVFLPIVFILYWFVTRRNLRLQNLLVVLASYLFYGWWDWRFISLIVISTVVDFTVGIRLARETTPFRRKALLFTSVFVNLGLLGFFKYFNFFIDNFTTAFSLFGTQIQPNTLNIILPVGISFYTFQTLSYTIDVYNRRIEPTKDILAFSAFVSFFPQLVAGPIERATHLLPQFLKERSFDYVKASDGCRQILWGLFKKVVIADNAALFANNIFNNSSNYSGSTLVLGAIFFSFQIYGDFSGYSDIAIGTARLFGFNLKQNFAFPYFSRDVAEFWRRWHISLTSFFRDYLYIPLGGSRGGIWQKIRNTFIIFIVCGFWHGASWTFVVWGLLNAAYFLPLLLKKSNRRYIDVVACGKRLPTVKEVLSIVLTFSLISFGWIFFRADSLSHAVAYIGSIFVIDFVRPLSFLSSNSESLQLLHLAIAIVILVIAEWHGRSSLFALSAENMPRRSSMRKAVYVMIVLMLILFKGSQQEFIYFAF